MKRLMLAIIAVCAVGATAQQQQQSPASIPKDLVVLLIGGGIMIPADDFDILLGAPAGFPAELVPSGAKPLIGTTTPTNVTVIAEAGNQAFDVAGFDRQLAAAGWTMGPRSGAQTRGLVAAGPTQMPGMWCKGNKYASVWQSPPRPGGRSIVRIGLSDTSRGNPCEPMGQPSFSSMQTDVEMPILFPPPGSRALAGGGSGGGSEHLDQRLRLETKLPLPEVLKHYRAQIEAHGWKFQSEAVADGLAVARFAAETVKKEPVTATLSLTLVPGEPPLEVALRVVRAPYRRFLP